MLKANAESRLFATGRPAHGTQLQLPQANVGWHSSATAMPAVAALCYKLAYVPDMSS